MAFDLLWKLKVNDKLDIKIRNYIAVLGSIVLILLLIKNTIKGSEFRYDTLLSIVTVVVFSIFYKKIGQNYISYLLLMSALVLHNLSLYPTSPFGIRFDHYMHFVSGFAISAVFNGMFTEKSKFKKFLILVFMSVGVGALGEILEWLGYAILGAGDGFFFYGIGDEGEWHNATFDMIFNLFGAFIFALIRFI